MRTVHGTRAALLVLLAAVSVGCAQSTQPEVALWQLDFYAASYDERSGLGSECRMVQVLVDEPVPIVPPWTATLTMDVERGAGPASTWAYQRGTASLEFALDTLGPDSVRLAVSGSYGVTLTGAPEAVGGYAGSWTCDATFPFDDDPDLLEAGLDPSAPIRGSWTLGPIPLPD